MIVDHEAQTEDGAPVRTETLKLEGDAVADELQQHRALALVGPVVVTFAFTLTLVAHVVMRWTGIEPTGLEDLLLIFGGAVATIAVPAAAVARRR